MHERNSWNEVYLNVECKIELKQLLEAINAIAKTDPGS